MTTQNTAQAINLPGLSVQEASKRLEQDGPNELSRQKKRTSLIIILEVLKEPMFLLLIASSGIYILLGDTPEALMLLTMVILVIGITFYQENKTEHTLEALRDLSSPRALVIRDGEQFRIPGKEVVRDDIVLLAEGDRVPADGLLISGPGLSVDESLLTGESVSVRKNPGTAENSLLYAGTLVVQGQGVIQVYKTGMHTELGKIGRSLERLDTEDTLLQKEVRRLVRLFGFWGALLCLLVLLTYGLLRGGWMKGLLAGITLAMSILPEEFPMVLTVFLALGAWRIAKSKVLTRRTHAIEALGAATALCTDKTGTLTLNRMTIVRLASVNGQELDLNGSIDKATISPDFTEVLTYAALASQPGGFDPMDKAARDLASRHQLSETLWSDFQMPDRIYPVTKDFLAMTLAWRKQDKYIIAAKGAPETILRLCTLNNAEPERIIRQVRQMAQDGLRILAVASARWESDNLPDSPEGFSFGFVGLLGYMDPIRPEVPDAIQACHTAGIRVLMITGDYPETARSIARQIGLRNPERVITGAMVAEMSDEELQKQVQIADTYARMIPEQKLRLVNALKANGEIVAMTGDGVNDAPALKAAHIGIAMGKRGTDVAREAAHLVLLDDNFSSIVQAIRLGRRIFDNLRKAMSYIFSVHIPIAGMAVLPVLFNWPLVLFPAHIAFIEIIIDPACSVAFEAEPSEENVMTRPPRPLNEPLFRKDTFIRAALQGNTLLLVILGVYGFALWQHSGEADARTMSFITLVVSNLMLITANLAGETSIFKFPFLKNKAYWLVLSCSLGLLILILTVPFFQALFHFSHLHPFDYGICLSASLIGLLILEGFRSFKQAPNHNRIFE